MSSTWRSGLWLALVLVALAAPVHAQSFGFPWWKDAQFQRDLTLTADQAAKIDSVFQSAITDLRRKNDELKRNEDELSRLIATGIDEAVVVKQIDKVEAIRSHMNKMRTLMLFHERQVLTPDQRERLKKLHEQWVKDHPQTRSPQR
jgi:Spy/CpxP family protein refolding chaperone